MPKKKGSPAKETARTKNAAAEKRVRASKNVKISIDVLGPLVATPEQIDRLKAYLENHLLTWVKSDLRNEPEPPIVSSEFRMPSS